MTIETQKEFQKIKDVCLARMVYAEEHDLVLLVPWSLKRIVVVRFSTDEIVLKHHFGVNAVITAMRRIGRWVFLRVSQPGEVHWVSVDLNTLELFVFAVSRWPNGYGLIGITGHLAVFSLHRGPEKEEIYQIIPDAILFDFRDGSSRVCPELTQVLRGGVTAVGGGHCFAGARSMPKWTSLTAYGLDEHGFPTLQDPVLLNRNRDRHFELLIHCSKERCITWVEKDLRIVVRDSNLQVLNEAIIPALSGGVDVQVVMMGEASQPVALLAAREMKAGSGGSIYLDHYYCYDQNFQSMLWSHEVVCDNKIKNNSQDIRIGVALGGYVVHSLLGGASLINVDTGEQKDVTLENVGFCSSTSYTLPNVNFPGFGHSWNPPAPTKHLFWQSDYGKPMNYGQVVE